ncbi:MAG: chemotaxis protein CheX [Candidatus Omnitrophota bacterium]
MEINDSDAIRKYLQITHLSFSKLCYFTPFDSAQSKIKARFLKITDSNVMLELAYVPPILEGYLVFFSYTFIFRFKARLTAGLDQGIFFCDFPIKIETFDRRRFARLKFESMDNKIISIYNRNLGTRVQGILNDVSVGGIGFALVDPEKAPKVGDMIVTKIDLPGKIFQAIVKVVQVREEMVGCAFLDVSKEFQLELNEIVKREIDWRSEIVLQNLRKREEILQSFSKSIEKKTGDMSIVTLIEKENVLDPFLDFFNLGFQSATETILNKGKVEYKENSALPYLAFLEFDVYFGHDFMFNCYFSCHRDVAYKLAVPMFKNKLAKMTVSYESILDELGKRLEIFADSIDKRNRLFTITNPHVIESNKRMLSDLLQRPSIQIKLESAVGEFLLMLLAPNLADSLKLCSNARAREFVTMEKVDLLEPISYSALRVFTEYLKLEIREKSVTTREQLLPRFEVSVILDIFFKDCEGKVILNLSKRLALKIYEVLLNEPADEFNTDVKDAVAEVTNMITGNAKNEFEKSGIYYKISTPIVLESRDGVSIYSKNMRFLSSVYWTSEGFFDLSFSFYKK